GGNSDGSVEGARQGEGCLGEMALVAQSSAVFPRRFDFVDPLLVGGSSHREGDEHCGQTDERRKAPRKSRRPPAAPFPPGLGEAAVRDAAQWQVVEVTPQVFGQRGGVAVAVDWLGSEALVDDVGQTWADIAVALAARPPPCPCRARPGQRLS